MRHLYTFDTIQDLDLNVQDLDNPWVSVVDYNAYYSNSYGKGEEVPEKFRLFRISATSETEGELVEEELSFPIESSDGTVYVLFGPEGKDIRVKSDFKNGGTTYTKYVNRSDSGRLVYSGIDSRSSLSEDPTIIYSTPDWAYLTTWTSTAKDYFEEGKTVEEYFEYINSEPTENEEEAEWNRELRSYFDSFMSMIPEDLKNNPCLVLFTDPYNEISKIWDIQVSVNSFKGQQPDNEIWYTTTDGKEMIQLSTYEEGGFFYEILKRGFESEDAGEEFTPDYVKTIMTGFLDKETAIFPEEHYYRGGLGVIKYSKPIKDLDRDWALITSNPLIEVFYQILGEEEFYSTFGLPENFKTLEIIERGKAVGNSLLNNLKEVSLPSGLTSIPNGAFVCQGSLKSVFYDRFSVDSIGGGAFSYCYSLDEFRLPPKITELKSDTFADCVSQSFNNLMGITSVGQNSLGDTGLDIINAESVRVLGFESIFMNSPNNLTIYLKDIERIESFVFGNAGDVVIYYRNSRDSWENVSKDPDWKSLVSGTITVRCSSGGNVTY